MEQLLLHLVGDYVTQTDWMAKNKVNSWFPAIIHAFVYSLPFLLIASPLQVLAIGGTHCIIDRFRLAKYLIFARNKMTDFSLKWNECDQTGFHSSLPPFMAIWLMIIADNTVHLLINFAVLKWM